MSSNDDLPPISIQQAVISSWLNALVLTNVLGGIYTMIYAGTLYLYVTRKTSPQHIVVAAFTLLYFFFVVQWVLQWYLLNFTFVINGATQETILDAVGTPGWLTLVTDICNLFQAGLSDALMIWRCFFVWNGSICIIALPSTLLLAEIALFLSVIIIDSVDKLNPPPSVDTTLDNLLSAASFMTATTTLMTSLLIAYRINKAIKEGVLNNSGSSKAFKRILDITVQSGAVYSIIAVIDGISGVVTSDSLFTFNFRNWTSTLLPAISGIAPTIMIARVAISNPSTMNESLTGDGHATSSISDIQFNGRRSITTNLTTNLTHGGIFIESEDTSSSNSPGPSKNKNAYGGREAPIQWS